ncbi:transferase, partial [Streptomyces fungicidicus]
SRGGAPGAGLRGPAVSPRRRAAACVLAAAGHRRAATACAAGWAAGTAELARARIVPGPRTRDEVTTVVATSVVIPPAATWYRLAGAWRHRNAPAWCEVAR